MSCTEWLTGGLHLLILWIALEAESNEAWPFTLAAMAVVSFFAWMGNYRRYRQVHDLPTSKVASAAQGYVELFGRSMSIPDSPVIAPLSNMPCCWYSYCIERKGSDNKRKQEARREVEKQHAQIRSGEGVHLMSKPADGRVFLLAGAMPDRIGRRFKLWSWGHLIFFFGAGIASFLLFR